jgi:hypothetical protein
VNFTLFKNFSLKKKYNKGYDGLTFNNMITTNKYQVSTHYVDFISFIRGKFAKGINVVSDVAYLFKNERFALSGINDLIFLYNDSGKGNICTIENGVEPLKKRTKEHLLDTVEQKKAKRKSLVTVDYSAKQRAFHRLVNVTEYCWNL